MIECYYISVDLVLALNTDADTCQSQTLVMSLI